VREADMDAAVEPMDVWQILNSSARLYRRNFRRLFGTALLVGLAGYAVNRLTVFGVMAYLDRLVPTAMSLHDIVLLLLLTLAMCSVALVVAFMQWGIIAAAASDAYLCRNAPLAATLRRIPFRSLLVASVVTTAIISAGLLLVVPGFIFSIVFIFVPLVSTLEGAGPTTALRRSWTLARAPMPGGFMNSTVARLFVIGTFAVILGLLCVAVTISLAEAAPATWKVEKTIETGMGEWRLPLPMFLPALQVVMDIISEAVAALFRPFPLCALVMLYYDIRARREGMDVEQMLDRLEGVRPAAAGDLVGGL
jgi:UPF0716 family protein affecting phage T7 exclusion